MADNDATWAPANDALALEYQGYYGCPRGNRNVFDSVNNPNANGICSVLGLRLLEEGGDRITGKRAAFFNDSADTALVR